jgi:hypothetical protein
MILNTPTGRNNKLQPIGIHEISSTRHIIILYEKCI